MIMIYYSLFFLQMYMYVTEIDESTVCMGPSNSSLPCVLSCGHPCLMCLQSQSIDTSILASDHQYSKNVSSKPNVATKSIGTNTDESMSASLNQQTVNNLVTTTPIKENIVSQHKFKICWRPARSTFDTVEMNLKKKGEIFAIEKKLWVFK